MKINKIIMQDVLKMVLVITLATVLAYAFESFEFRAENILLLYVVATLIVILETMKLKYGIICACICALVYLFIFIAPKYSFIIEDISVLITIFIYLAVCLVISIMSYRLQAQIKKAERSENLVKSTYENSKSLLKLKSPEDIANYEVKKLNTVLNRKVCIGLKKRKNFVFFGETFIAPNNNYEEFNYAMNYNLICGYKEQKYSNLNYKIYPLKNAKTNFGIIVIDCSNGDIKKNEKEYIKTNITHIVMALEREKIQDQKEDVKEKIEIEKLKNALVLNVSSDIREPITVIGDKCKVVLNNYDALSDESITNAIMEIRDENKKLKNYVDYLFNISSLNSGEEVKNEKKVNLKNILISAIDKYKNNKGHQINLFCDDIKMVLDPELMENAFENIIANAFEYTDIGCELNIKCFVEDNDVVIDFEDNGEGISEDNLDTIFDAKQNDDVMDYKVGLNVCKKIVEAHNGKIRAYNNSLGGLTIRITLKVESK